MASDYIEEALPPQTAKAMRLHAQTCASCKSDETALRSLSRELNVLPSVDPPLFFSDNVMAAIEHQSSSRRTGGAWWQTMLPQLGRVALGTALTGGVVVAAAWMLLLPSSGTPQAPGGRGTAAAPQIAHLPVVSPLLNLLPGSENEKGTTPAPRLQIARVTTMVPSSGPAFDLALWMENADGGTARFNLMGDKTAYRFHLSGVTAPQTLRVPFSASQNKQTVDLRVYWTANATDHTRYLFVPLPPQSSATKDDKTASLAAPSERQSFGLPDQTLTEAARQIAARYNVPVTLDDVSDSVRVQIVARDETAPETLFRALEPLHLRVSVVKGGLLVEPAPTAAAPAALPSPASAVQ